MKRFSTNIKICFRHLLFVLFSELSLSYLVGFHFFISWNCTRRYDDDAWKRYRSINQWKRQKFVGLFYFFFFLSSCVWSRVWQKIPWREGEEWWKGMEKKGNCLLFWFLVFELLLPFCRCVIDWFWLIVVVLR